MNAAASFPGLGLNGCHRDGSPCESRQYDSSNVLFTLKLAGIASALPYPNSRRYTTSLAFEVHRQGVIDLSVLRARSQPHWITLGLVSGFYYARFCQPLFPNCALTSSIWRSEIVGALELLGDVCFYHTRFGTSFSTLFSAKLSRAQPIRRPSIHFAIELGSTRCTNTPPIPIDELIQPKDATSFTHLTGSALLSRMQCLGHCLSNPPFSVPTETQDRVDSRMPSVDCCSGERLPLGLISLSSTKAVDHSQLVQYLELVGMEYSSVALWLVSGNDSARL
ncbi:hypothetical protein NMY22_g12044 [Coprinellus aureogranulatus]|nr:hypothetical protein NMY22_g12044 [Coprinellus aureogranulatus]